MLYIKGFREYAGPSGSGPELAGHEQWVSSLFTCICSVRHWELTKLWTFELLSSSKLEVMYTAALCIWEQRMSVLFISTIVLKDIWKKLCSLKIVFYNNHPAHFTKISFSELISLWFTKSGYVFTFSFFSVKKICLFFSGSCVARSEDTLMVHFCSTNFSLLY